ncbi:MAG TPA: SGNH/GDSL hydrolase family protein [Candidatus Paceibacterota bacterium]|nr:SGNH/GDSL hydrolase family protein [Candidatus Paceibacterota bacterium]
MNHISKMEVIPGKRFCARFSGPLIALGLLASPFMAPADDTAQSPFYLKAGDKVCFYGDSITEQRFYGVDVETYVRTRFPDLKVKFVNSGVGGDRVTGGWAGPIDLRLERDVFPFKPNVVTIMLGMNDGEYRAFDQSVFATYTNGYEHIIQSLQQHLPGVRIVLIQPTPYDDVTYPPKFPGGYNAVLLRYSAFVRQLAAEHNLMCVDFMTPLLDVMQRAQAQDPKLAHDVIPGRIHPSPVGELVMAQSLLQAWNAPSNVSAVSIDAAKIAVVKSDHTAVSDLKAGDDGNISWTQKDGSLPFPILGLHENWPQFPPTENNQWGQPSFFWPAPEPKWDSTNAAAEMIVKLSGFYDALDQEPLQVSGLKAGNYRLKINGQTVGEFSDRQLDDGVNLAEFHTPMLEQSCHVLDLVWKQVQWRYYAWRDIQIRLMDDQDPKVQKTSAALIAALEAQKDKDAEQQYTAARPKPAHYELSRLAN